MPRIGLYLGFAPEGGGAFQYADSILQALSALPAPDYDLVIAYGHPEWAKRLNSLDRAMHTIPFREGLPEAIVQAALRFGFSLKAWRAVARHVHPLTRRLLDSACDFWVFPAQEVWTYALPAPTLGVIHDLMHRYERCFPEVSAFGLYRRRERHYRRVCATARGVLVDSSVGKHHVIESFGLEPERIHVLPYAPTSWLQTEPASAEFDQRYRLPERFIFYPAQFWAHKNHIRLLEAMARVRPSIPDLHLVLTGSSKNGYEAAMCAIKTLGLADRVHVLGYVPQGDIPEFYRRAQGLVMPTFFGPTNLPPLEAASLGCPVAVSKIYAMPEQLGDAALYFDPRSTDEIAAAILRLVSDEALRARLVIAGKQRASAWTQSHFNERFRSILDMVTGG